MTATDTNQPPAGTDPTNADTRASAAVATDGGPPLWFYACMVVILAGIAAFLGACYMSWEKSLEAERTEQRMVQRELRAYAKMNDLPVENIVVTRPINDLVVTWTQGNQTCTVFATKPKTGDQLWGTQPIEEGSGACLTKSGSNGINTPDG